MCIPFSYFAQIIDVVLMAYKARTAVKVPVIVTAAFFRFIYQFILLESS